MFPMTCWLVEALSKFFSFEKSTLIEDFEKSVLLLKDVFIGTGWLLSISWRFEARDYDEMRYFRKG